MKKTNIHTIDLNFQGRPGTIAVYLVPHVNGCILIETGPTSTIQALISGLNTYGYTKMDVTDVLLTHIHLDHAGAAGWWAKQGARIHVHEYGAPHLIDPEKLLSSARRLYGEMMDPLWGEFLPINQGGVVIVHDQELIQINNLSILAMDAPGHASHHLVYLIEDACFCGDIAGIRISLKQFLSLPTPPPDFHLEKWRASIQQILGHKPKYIIPTHYGIYTDTDWHLQAVLYALDDVEAWMEAILAHNPSTEEFRQQFIEFEHLRAVKLNIEKATAEAQQIANPSFMSADGILRYWNKYRKPG
jgi:glyoxylase-like metal-dependent hydrolase (beta-lactamase superfamily II)